MPPYPPPEPTVGALGPPISRRFTPGAQPPSARADIQLTPLPWRGQEWPHQGRPVRAEFVQSLQVALGLVLWSMPWALVPVRTSWLSGHMLPEQPGAPSWWLGTPVSLGRSLMMAGSAPRGRVWARSALLAATRRPRRSYQGP